MRITQRKLALAGAVAAVALAGGGLIDSAVGDSGKPKAPEDASWTTVYTSPLGLEGLTADDDGFLYSTGRGGTVCPVQRVPAAGGPSVVVGYVRTQCSPSGLTFDAAGRLYITGIGAQQDEIWALTPNADAPPDATVYATGVPGANGVAFDGDGNLWTGDGTTGQGRVWRIPPGGGAGVEVFRVQPMVNSVTNTLGVPNVGRDVGSVPPRTVTVTSTGRNASNTAGSQPLVANGVAFTRDGSLLVADTARGALWRVDFDRHGDLESPVGCDSTFPADTLCLDDVWVQHPALEGVDGIALDRAGNVWAAANERNAIVVVDHHGRVSEFFRSPADATTQLRNNGPLEFPTSPFLVGRSLCVTHSDGSRRDNVPNSGGEVGPGHTGAVAKISCLDQRLQVPGLPLPVH